MIQHTHLPQTSPPPEAVIYARVSSARQVEEGHGLESQATRCREYAERKGYEVIETFHEKGVSGGIVDRPSFNAMLDFVKQRKREGVIVVIDDISRFSRDIESHWALRRTLKETGGKLESPSITFGEDSDSILIENLLASVSQHQRQKNGEQTKNRMRARVMNGYWVFHAPTGYKYNEVKGHGKLLVRDEPIASIIAEALEGFASGRFETQAEIKRYLESQPDFTNNINKYGEVRYEEIVRLLRRPIYAGYIERPNWGVSLRKGHHEGLISLEQHKRIQERIKQGARVPARKDINEDFPLRGFITCGTCNNPLTSCWSTSKTGRKHPYYMCFDKSCQSYRKSIRRDVIEGEFETLLKQMRPSANLFRMVKDMFRQSWDYRLAQTQEIAKTLRRDMLKIEKQIEKMLDYIVEAESITTAKAYEQRISKLEKDKLVLAEKLKNGLGPKRTFEEMFELAFTFLANPWKLWSSGRLEDKRTVLKLTFADRLAYQRGTGLRTPKTTSPFNMLRDIPMGICEMAGCPPTRFPSVRHRPLGHLSLTRFTAMPCHRCPRTILMHALVTSRHL